MGYTLLRRALATAVAATSMIGFATAARADNAFIDNDTATPGAQHSADFTVNPGDLIETTAQTVIAAQGSKHLLAGSSVTMHLDSSNGGSFDPPDLSVPDASGTVPTPWGAGSASFTITSNVSFHAPSTPGTYSTNIKLVPTNVTCAPGDTGCLSLVASGDPLIVNVTVLGPTPTPNTAPTVAFTSPVSSADEGDTKTFNFTITDPDAGDTQSFATNYPDCGTGNTVSNASITNTGGSFDCTFVDGLVPAVDSTVSVRSFDGTALSNLATTLVTVSNVNPTVARPSFAVTSVNCRTAVTLNGISFSDPGVNDANWSVDIDWGDSSTHTTFSAATQGAQTSQTHTYTAPGSYTATVSVTDKDTGNGSNTSSNQIQVLQVYNTMFLQPFDGSNPTRLIPNTMKSGRVVPVKATIYDVCAQAYVTSGTVTIKVTKSGTTTSSTPDPVETYADAGASSGNSNVFRWSADSTVPGGGFWIYNLDSKALALVVGTCYRIDLYVGTTLATATNWAIVQPVK